MQGAIVKRAACTGPTQLNAAEIQAALDAHNLHRGQAGNGDGANELKLVWNDELASRAQDWADLCVWKHTLVNECDEVTSVGQNLYMTSASSYDIAEMVKAWADEKLFYTYNTGACTDVCGHYTQMVWANTMDMGCGIAQCGSVEGGFNNAWVFGCDYSPPGNYAGQKPYVQGLPCSACETVIPTGGWTCEANLCKPCTPDADGASCNCEAKLCENGGAFNPGQCACECPSDYYGSTCERKCECVDLAGYETACPSWTGFCTNAMYKTFMTNTCPATCGLCDLPPSCNA